MKIEEQIAEITENPIKELGYNLVDVEYVKEGTNFFLRLYIEKEKGTIDLEDCEKVSRCVDEIIDKKDIIKDTYFLEVSSCGLERVLKKEVDFEKYKGSKVQVKLYKAYDGKKEYIGKLIELSDGKLIVKQEDENNKVFNMQDVAKVKTVFDFED